MRPGLARRRSVAAVGAVVVVMVLAGCAMEAPGVGRAVCGQCLRADGNRDTGRLIGGWRASRD